MKYFEMINELKNDLANEQHITKEYYITTENKLVKLLGDYILGSDVICKAYGNGKVIAVTGNMFTNIIIETEFANVTKRFSLLHLMTVTDFVKFVNDTEIHEAWNTAYEVHNNLAKAYHEYELKLKQQMIEAAKKAEADKKAADRYARLKNKALKDFEEMQNRAKETVTQADEFYYALGWLAKHTGTVTAALPDYLADAFAKAFGSETPCKVVDSTHRGPAGWQSQWSWSFKATLKKSENIPNILSTYLNTAGKAIANTAFIWDLVDDYGFQFGKKQDVEKIKNTVPAKYLAMFEEGFAA